MKINDKISNVSTNIESNSINKKKDVAQAELFGKKLQEFKTRDGYDYLSGLAEKITTQGQRLANKMDINELRYYKKMVSEFLQFAVSDTFSFESDTLPDRSGRISVFSTIEKVNEKLDKLTEEMLKDEKDNIEVIKLLDDIRGLVIDVYM